MPNVGCVRNNSNNLCIVRILFKLDFGGKETTLTFTPTTVLLYLISKVDHNEGAVGHPGLLEVLTAGVASVQLLGPVLVGSFWHLCEKRTEKERKPTGKREEVRRNSK